MSPARGGTKKADNPTLFVFDDFEEGQSHLAFAASAQHLDIEGGLFAYTAPLKVDLAVYRALETYTLNGTVAGQLTGECGRCLEAARVSFAAELRLLLQRRSVSDEEREALEEDDEIVLVEPGNKEVDLQPLLREAIILELPVRIYCRDQCMGLCSQCGVNLNEGNCSCDEQHSDPRWAALEQLKS